MIKNIDAIKRAEINFVSRLEKLYIIYPKWSYDEIKSIYTVFIEFCTKIKSEPLALLRVAEVQLRNKNNMIDELLTWDSEKTRWYILNILTNDSLHISMKIALIGAICKLLIENNTRLERK